MWIFDSYFKGCVELWSRERGLERFSAAYPPSFYMHLKDPHAHWGMIEGLASRYKVEECSFNSIFGTFEGHRIYASRKVAEKIDFQTRYAAELYNVDIRQDQRYLALQMIYLEFFKYQKIMFGYVTAIENRYLNTQVAINLHKALVLNL